MPKFTRDQLSRIRPPAVAVVALCGSSSDAGMLVLTELGELYWAVDTGHPPSDLGDATLVNTSVPAFNRCLRAHNALWSRLQQLPPLPAGIAEWRGVAGDGV